MLKSIFRGKTEIKCLNFQPKNASFDQTPPPKKSCYHRCHVCLCERQRVWQAGSRRRGDSTLLSVSSAGCKTWTGLPSPPSSSSVDGLNLPVSCWPRYDRHQAAESGDQHSQDAASNVLVTDMGGLPFIFGFLSRNLAVVDIWQAIQMINDARKAVERMRRHQVWIFSFVIYIIWDLISAAVCSFSFNLFKRALDSPLSMIICWYFPILGPKSTLLQPWTQ